MKWTSSAIRPTHRRAFLNQIAASARTFQIREWEWDRVRLRRDRAAA